MLLVWRQMQSTKKYALRLIVSFLSFTIACAIFPQPQPQTMEEAKEQSYIYELIFGEEVLFYYYYFFFFTHSGQADFLEENRPEQMRQLVVMMMMPCSALLCLISC